jgi:DNA-binding response OmpR family regulator
VEIMSTEQRKNTGIPEDGILQVSNELTFDAFKSELRANSTGKTVYLTGKSLGLLLLLASTPDEVVTHDSIIDHVWGDRDVLGKDSSDHDYDKKRLRGTVSRLREKIDSLELYFNPIVVHKYLGYSFSPKPRNTD